jgi:hypothetical protein
MAKKATNKEMANTKAFADKCAIAEKKFGLEPGSLKTTRQISKYRNGKGIVYKVMNNLI